MIPTVLRRLSMSGAQPRHSASLVVLNQRNEVLLVHRNPNSTSFGGMHVFPGGNVDESQDNSLEVTAIRETFEETGLLLASTSDSSPLGHFPSDSILDQARHAIHDRETSFGTFLQSHCLVADVGSLLPFTQWITPVGFPRRFQTQFYVTFLSPLSEKTLPSHDGDQEVIETLFQHPKKTLQAIREGKIRTMPPQFYILSTLADIFSGAVTTPDQRKKLFDLSSGDFGKMTITPRKLGHEDGHSVLALNGDETYGGAPGRRHRILGKFSESKAMSAFGLIRNFDVSETQRTSRL